jgi:hypothetical protein
VKLVIRPMHATDRTFVVESWISSYRRSPHAGLISMGAWHEVMTATIDAILARPGVQVLVAADADAAAGESDLFGWLAWMPHEDGPYVFFVYVKHAARYDTASRTGPRIATRLFQHARIDPRGRFSYACLTHVVGSLSAAGKIPRAKWRPLLGRFPEERTRGRSEAA